MKIKGNEESKNNTAYCSNILHPHVKQLSIFMLQQNLFFKLFIFALQLNSICMLCNVVALLMSSVLHSPAPFPTNS